MHSTPSIADPESPELIFASMMEKMDTQVLKLKTSKLLERVIGILIKSPMSHLASTSCCEKTFGNVEVAPTQSQEKESMREDRLTESQSEGLKQPIYELQEKHRIKIEKQHQWQRHIERRNHQQYEGNEQRAESTKATQVDLKPKQQAPLNSHILPGKTPKRYQKYLQKAISRSRQQR